MGKNDYTDEYWMQRCLILAAQGGARVAPNPQVGAVVVKDGRIIAEGYHHCYGGEHAEVNALKKAGSEARGATLYVNLEPCNHHGKTPPCTKAIKDQGIREVVYGIRDPHVPGDRGGVEQLRRDGVGVRGPVLEEPCRKLNEVFFVNIMERRTFVALKWAQTTNGFLAPKNGRRFWLTSDEAVEDAHYTRSRYQAILVGASTIRADDPRLDVRYGEGPSPQRFVISESLDLPQAAAVFLGESPAIVLSPINQTGSGSKRKVAGFKVEYIKTNDRSLFIKSVTRYLYDHKIYSLLVEGGAETLSQFLFNRLADRVYIYLSPIFLNDGIQVSFNRDTDSEVLKNWSIDEIRQVGSDLCISLQRKE